MSYSILKRVRIRKLNFQNPNMWWSFRRWKHKAVLIQVIFTKFIPYSTHSHIPLSLALHIIPPPKPHPPHLTPTFLLLHLTPTLLTHHSPPIQCLPYPTQSRWKDWLGTNTIEFHTLPKTPNGKGIQTIKSAQAESQEDSSFPADGHRAIPILNKMNKRPKRNKADKH